MGPIFEHQLCKNASNNVCSEMGAQSDENCLDGEVVKLV